MAPNHETDVIVKVAKVEERLATIAEKLLESANQNQAMWKKIDIVIERLIAIESIIQNSEINKFTSIVNSLNSEVSLLKAWKDSIWRFTQPAFSSFTGAAIAYLLHSLGGK